MPRQWVNMLVPAAGGGRNSPNIQKSIRFAKKGCTNRPFFHIEVHNKNARQHMQPIEQLGTYDPIANMHNEKLVSFNYERIKYWMADGARVSKPVAQLLGLAGFLPIHPRTYMRAWRNRKTILQRYEDSLKPKETKPEEQT